MLKSICAILLLLSASADAFWHGLSDPIPTLVCNVVAASCAGPGGGSSLFTAATCNGVADDSAAFISVNSFSNTWQATHSGLIEWDIPHGGNCFFNNGNDISVGDGIKKLRVVGLGYSGAGDGATFTSGTGGFFLGAFRGVFFDNTHSARTATVSAGSNCVALATPAQASLFNAGDVTLIAGIDMQGTGDPPNPYFYEWPKIASVDAAHQCNGVTAGASVTFTAGLAHTYKSTWPLFNPGDAFHSDGGGPATLYAIAQQWDAEFEYRGITFNTPKQTEVKGRSAILRHVKSLGGNCTVPSENQIWLLIDSDFSNCTNSGNGLEIDKIIGTATMQNTAVYKVVFQSTSVDTFNFINSTASNGIFNTPKKFVGTGATINAFTVGAGFFGATSEVICTSCNVTTWNTGGVGETAVATFTVTANNIHIPASYFKDHGGANTAVRWGVPGANLMYYGIFPPTTPAFQISDIVRNGDGSVDVTTNSAGLPNTALWAGSGTTVPDLVGHPAPKFTCTSCTGSADSASLSNAPAATPLGTYAQTTLNATTTSYSPLFFWGALSSVSFNVTVPYTGTGLGVNLEGGQGFVRVVQPGGTTTGTWDPAINAKVGGTRTVTPTTVSNTCAGGTCSGDSLGSAPGAIFILGQQAIPRLSIIPAPGDMGSAAITVIMQTTQGVVPGP